jgi:hypothetical protein
MAKVNVLASGSANNEHETAHLEAFGKYQMALALSARARVEHCLFHDRRSFARVMQTSARKARAAVRLAMVS